MPKIKILYVKDSAGIDQCPNIYYNGSVSGMKKLYWGKDAKVVRCGSYYYNVTGEPRFYDIAHRG